MVTLADVERRIGEAVAEEREACAKECDAQAEFETGIADDPDDNAEHAAIDAAEMCANRIRARGAGVGGGSPHRSDPRCD
jgi:hypothetical protein